MRARHAVVWLVLAGCGAAGARPAPSAAPADDPWRDLLVTRAQCREPGARRVSPGQMAEDWRVLLRVLRRGWAGWGVAGEPASFRSLAGLGRRGFGEAPAPSGRFLDALADRLSFVRDNHLALWLREPDGGMRRRRPGAEHRPAFAGELLLQRRDGVFVDARGWWLLDCDGRSAHALLRPTVRGDPPRARWMPVVLGAEPDRSLSCRLRARDGRLRRRAVELRRLAPPADEAGPVLERRTIEPALPWLRLRSLSQGHREALERFEAAGASVRDAPVVVLDLRGNGGGGDAFLRDFFLALGNRKLGYFDSRRVHSEVTLQGDVSFWRCALEQAERSGVAGGRSLEWLRGRLARAERVLEAQARVRGRPFRTVLSRRTRTKGTAPGAFEGRLLVVVDAGCASACEAAVMYARQLPGTVVVGENTAGVDAFTEVRLYRLPHSGIFVEAGMKHLRDPRLGCFPEGVGYQPDLWLGGETLERDVARLARCLADERCARRALPQPSSSSSPSPGSRWVCSASTSPP